MIKRREQAKKGEKFFLTEHLHLKNRYEALGVEAKISDIEVSSVPHFHCGCRLNA